MCIRDRVFAAFMSHDFKRAISYYLIGIHIGSGACSPLNHVYREPVSYTHLDVYKRQPSNIRYRNRKKMGYPHTRCVTMESITRVVRCLLYTSYYPQPHRHLPVYFRSRYRTRGILGSSRHCRSCNRNQNQT